MFRFLFVFLLLSVSAHAQMIGLAGLLDPGASGLIAPRHAGKPDPRWQAFKWKYQDVILDRARVRLYFYEGEEWTAQMALPEIRREVGELKKLFNYSPNQDFSYLLFSSHRNFQQTNVFYISEGVQGVTSTTEPVMAVPYWGQAETFRHISTHEMVHQFQVQKLNELSEGYAGRDSSIPLWFIEGMAEHYSLGGMDVQSRHFLRDLMVYPDKKRDNVMPKFLEDGPMNFIGVYKIGQAKLDFIETEFGKGMGQKFLEKGAKPGDIRSLKLLFTDTLGTTEEALEAKWKTYTERFKAEADALKQDFSAFEEVKSAGDTVDHYEISPDGSLIATREIDVLTGRAHVKLIDVKTDDKKEVDEDRTPSILSLHFMQVPILALGNSRLAFVADTSAGPEIEVKRIERSGDDVDVSGEFRIKLHEHGIQEASSLTLNLEENRIAFVGLDREGRENVHVVAVEKGAAPVKLTNSHYSYRELKWGKAGILAASDQTEKKRYGVFLLNPESREVRLIHASGVAGADEVAPDGEPESHVFQSWSSGSSQIHIWEAGKERRLTEAKTALSYPRLRGGYLYFIGYKSGRYGLYRLKTEGFINQPSNHGSVGASAWTPELQKLEGVEQYKPFRFSNIRIDELTGFLGSGSVIGIGTHVSDLMRDYGLGIQFATLGSSQQLNAQTVLTSRRGRFDWTGGFYYTSLPRIGEVFDQDTSNDIYLNREYGVLGGVRYPFSAFSYGEFLVGVGNVSRADYEEPLTGVVYSPSDKSSNFAVSPTLRLGRDRVDYEPFTGPFSGYGILLESTYGLFPGAGKFSDRYRFDASYYFRLFGPTVLALEGIAGSSRGFFAEPFFVSSDDVLRAYRFGDIRLLGNYMLVGRSEIRFPIGLLFRFPYLRGLVGADFGTVHNRREEFASRTATSYSAGLLLNLPPISLQFIWSKPLRVAPGPKDSSVFHLALRYLYF